MNILASADLVILDECSLEARVILSLKAVRFDPLLIRNDLRTKSEKTPNMGVGEKYPSYVLLCCLVSRLIMSLFPSIFTEDRSSFRVSVITNGEIL